MPMAAHNWSEVIQRKSAGGAPRSAKTGNIAAPGRPMHRCLQARQSLPLGGQLFEARQLAREDRKSKALAFLFKRPQIQRASNCHGRINERAVECTIQIKILDL